MAKRKIDEPPKGSPGWTATFADLMNLLLCFFVLLFSMSTVDADKYEQVIASIQSAFSILPSGGSAVLEESTMVSSGISQLDNLDVYYKEGDSGGSETAEEGDEDFKEQFESAALTESEEISEQMEEQIQQNGIADKVEIEVNGQYVKLSINGSLLFDSGKAEIREDALPIVDKLGSILELYAQNQINIVGHTDNVPISNEQYENNDVLAIYRALSLKDYLVEHTLLEQSNLIPATRGENAPVADNSSEEGRARNRRVEIHVYNSYYTE